MTLKRLILLVLVVGAIAACMKQARSKHEAEWLGLTEDEARAKLDAKLPGHIPGDKRAMIADKVVDKLGHRGMLADAPA